MTIPTATYRIQFRIGMTFDRAAALVPYLKRLGISHLYASPVLTATSGSTHGYDVTDANQIDPAIGGREGFDRMVKALKAEGLGLILDIVPNHMAASLENAWWRDVVENGEKSRYARHFDIDWTRKLTLPFLSDTFEKVLEADEISVKSDPETGKPALAYSETFYPLNPATYTGREAEILKATDKAAVSKLHDTQPYRLMSWRDARHELSYRRFFEITGLIGVRVEDGPVFDDTHRLILELVRSGAVDGLRVDHVDGLADPKAYLERLRREAGPACYIIVEKILGEGEQVPADWPISGTTGYEFIAALSDALVDGEKLDELREAYQDVAGQPISMRAELRKAKLLMADNNFAVEFAALVKLALQIAQAEDTERNLSKASIKTAIRELLVAFPVYRTYGTRDGLPPEGREMLAKVLDQVRQSPNVPEPRALAFLKRIFEGDVGQQARGQASLFRIRFQQLSGPLMAKSVEDTLFFRQHMALALNEVGAEPLPRSFSIERYHREMQTRLQRQPEALLATSTHDTKRGEDARARLYTITEAPKLWAEAVKRWRKMNRQAVQSLGDSPAPEPEVEWMLYQALAGVWPTDFHPEDCGDLKSLEERFIAYAEKVLREAKLRTTWGDVNASYEKAVLDYARRLFAPNNQSFLADFANTLRPFIRAGLINSLAQTIIKLTAPGVPDIYQGSEGLDLSLVDPDNRRKPDFDLLQKHLSKETAFDEEEWQTGQLKQRVVAVLLRLRQELPSLFSKGDYIPLSATGENMGNIVAFARAEADDVIIVTVQRLNFSGASLLSRWQGVSLTLPSHLQNRRFEDLFSKMLIEPGEHLDVTSVAPERPFAVFRAI
ncbi:malto-oligosyltrehalose synthase [Rhizobium lusitanum]|uniref:Malto-oligosyltrehalose synthase n=1 Tax=Rhizobium lusitanum TaxID=293958 RepID=A0A6L9UF21_9HYPH|nr:malto-oligosyltrehalose synthase [Rhizobium lusitanum]NEI73188.1 malto-oligosyltrehalose synthase [Rhizobium lusitanum]